MVQAQTLARELAHAVDHAAERPFQLNPASPGVGDQVALALLVRPSETIALEGEGFTDERETGRAWHAGLAVVGGDTGNGSRWEVELERFGLASGDAQAGDDDEAAAGLTRLAARYATAVGPARAGLLVQGYRYELAGVRFADDVTSDTVGTTIGLGAGVRVGKPGSGLGLYYYPAQRGTAEAEGEHRILERRPLAGLELAFRASTAMTFGLYARYAAEAREGADADPAGAEHPFGQQPDAAYGLGWQVTHQGKIFHRLTLGQEVFSAEQARPVDAVTELRLSVGTEERGVETSLGLSGYDKNPSPATALRVHALVGLSL